jgi:hypothetical protein
LATQNRPTRRNSDRRSQATGRRLKACQKIKLASSSSSSFSGFSGHFEDEDDDENEEDLERAPFSDRF